MKQSKLPQHIEELVKHKILEPAGAGAGAGAKPELRWVKTSQLYIPEAYQRPAKSQSAAMNIGYIKTHFNWASFGALSVCELAKSKPPQYAIIDGQHRFKAAEQLDIYEVPCVIFKLEGEKAEAAHFIEVNTKRTRLHVLHQYRASIVAGDASALMVDALLKKAKVSVPDNPLNQKNIPPKCTQAIGTIMRMIDHYSEKQILWAFETINKGLPTTPGTLRASLLKTMAEWIKTYPDTNQETMAITLSNVDLDQLEKDARSYRAIERGSMPSAFLKVIKRQYDATKKELA